MMRKGYWLLLIALLAACAPKTAALLPTATATQPAPAPTFTAPATTPTPSVYVVQAGDTLSTIAARFEVSTEELQRANNIADPNLIHVGQKLIIPGPTPAVTPTLPPTLTPSPQSPPQLEILGVIGRGAPGTETAILVNRGRPALLTGWSLRDDQGNAYIFPNIYLGTGAELRVHTGPGENTPQHLYWGRDTAVWGEAGDTVILADERGVVYASKVLD
ncbi:MAG: LysM peptidoglycan-binding domain-containing protein [Anaerolineae bacterium]|nr:LysM peptidoglycan-binding domain-containing protein [Anaerolineae bacterium]